MRIVHLDENSKKNVLENLLKRSPNHYAEYEKQVADILAKVREEKDTALFAYTKQFDGAELSKDTVLVTKEEIKEAYSLIEASLITVIQKAIVEIRAYHEKQKQYSWFDSTPSGTILGQKVTPLSKVGVYVPGGKAAYPSSVLMNVVPAKVAGVEEIIMTTPCNKEGKVNPATLVAAKEAGVNRIFKVGRSEERRVGKECRL